MDLIKIAELANPALTALLGGSGIWAWAKSKTERNDSEDRLLLAIARTQLVEQGREYIKRGYVTMDEYEEYEDHYKLYSNLGGNGLARRIFEQVDDLPMMPSGIEGRKN